jgi:4-amino-4-deoxy-L-arabinose transferase-like glycosyltransferase
MAEAEARTPLAWCRALFTGVLFSGARDTDSRARPLALLLLLLLPGALLYPTRGFHLLEPDEGRYAQIPKEMLETGSWVVPTLQGEPYLDKPPLMYWITALSYKAFGVTPEAARLVPALCVHLTILSVYLLGRLSIGHRAAFWAALLLALAPGFVSVARLLLLDGLLTLCVTVSVLCGYEAVRTGTFRRGWWVASAVASGFGFLTKGPISEVLLFIPLWAYAVLAAKHAAAPARPGLKWYVAFFAVVFAVNLPWYIAIGMQQPQFLKYFFWEHNVMRFLQPFDHLQPIWYYVPILVGGLLTASVLLAAYFWQLARGSASADAKPSAAGGFWLLAGGWCAFFFSCSGSKLPTYVLPAYPFLCLAVGEFVARSSWNTAIRTRALVSAAALLLLFVHYGVVPWYAKERSPNGRPELIAKYVNDRGTAVVPFPRNCDSIAFYYDRADLKNVRTKEVNQLIMDCHHRPRTVILFTHRDSLTGFKNTLPPSLKIVETATFKRKTGGSVMDKLAGSTPWGLCDVAVVIPLYHVPPKAPPANGEGAEEG